MWAVLRQSACSQAGAEARNPLERVPHGWPPPKLRREYTSGMEARLPPLAVVRAHYSESDPVHGWDHVQRVAALADRVAVELGADRQIVQAAAWLHDVAGALPEPGSGQDRAAHERASAERAAEILAAEGWTQARIAEVQHCIRAHRFRGTEAAATLEAKVVFDADKLDVLGAMGAARTIAFAVQAGTPLYAPVSERFRQTGELEAGELHSAFHEYVYKLSKVFDRLHTDPARRLGQRRRAVLEVFFEALAREAEAGDLPARDAD
jgi:uncharacterized protein